LFFLMDLFLNLVHPSVEFASFAPALNPG